MRIWVRNPLCHSYLCDAAFYHTVGYSSGIVDYQARGPEIGSGSYNYEFYTEYPIGNMIDHYDIITDISDANP